MRKVENNEQIYISNEEISLKELIYSILNEKFIISIVTAIVLFATMIYTFLIVSPVYRAETELLIKNPEAVGTRYGSYTFPSTNINDYIQYLNSNAVIERVLKENGLDDLEEDGMTIEAFRDRINITKDEGSNRFKVAFEHSDQDLVYELNQSLINIYIKTLRIKYKSSAVDQFINGREISIDNFLNSIEREETLMTDTKDLLDSIIPIYTLQKLLFSDPTAAAAYAKEFNLDISDLSENVMTQEYVNGNYFSIEFKYLETKTNLISLRESLYRSRKFHNELLEEQAQINKYMNTDNEDRILNGVMDVMRDNIIVISEAYRPINPISPNKMLNLAIGLVLGLGLGVFAGLFRSYWKTGRI